jgi:hypothetical protein
MQMLSLGLVFLNLAHVKRGCFSRLLFFGYFSVRTKRRLKKEEMEDGKGHTCSTG